MHSPLATEQATQSGGFPLGSVMAFILALCVSQLIIVFGGLSGEKGSAKLDTIVQKLTSVFSA